MPEVFHIVPASIRWGWALLLMLLPLAVIVVALSGIGYSLVSGSQRTTFELSDQGLRLKGDFYGRTIARHKLRFRDVAMVDIETGPYRPVMRTNGIAIPGYRAGWFRLRNGRKALLYVTTPESVVLVPTTDNYDVLLSVADAPRFVERMRALAAPATAALP